VATKSTSLLVLALLTLLSAPERSHILPLAEAVLVVVITPVTAALEAVAVAELDKVLLLLQRHRTLSLVPVVQSMQLLVFQQLVALHQ
jgi:hypothetical protein